MALEVKAVYSVLEIARAARTETRVMHALLVAVGIAPIKAAKHWYVTMIDLQERFPKLWAGIQCPEQARAELAAELCEE